MDMLRHGLRRALTHLRWDSVQLRNAVRTGVALGVACVIARLTKVQHGFWIELATLTVVSSTARITGRRVVSAIAGTAVGVLLGIVIIDGVGSNVTIYAWVTPIAIAAAIWARAAIGFGAGQCGFTIAVLVLFSLLKPAGWQIGLLRFEDVSIGVAVALAVSVVAWPGGARRALARDLHDLRFAAASYLRSVVDHRALGFPRESDLARQRNRATASALRTEDAFAQRLSEHPPNEEIALWADRVSAANRLWYSADLIRSIKEDIVISATAMAAAAHLEATVQTSAAPDAAAGVLLRGSDADFTPSDPLASWIADLANANRRA
jgi:uncharacterized membrane protein YccC